jgi:hypothetical protein
MKNNNITLSTSRNLKFYLLDYRDKKVENELDVVKDTIFLSKINNNEDLYINHFENVIYLKGINLNSILSNVVLKQNKKIYVIQDRKEELDLLIPLDKNNKIYVYKDYKILDMLSQEKDTTYIFENSDLLTDYEVLEVKFNGKVLDSFNFDKTLKKLNIGMNILDYQYLNNIQIFLAKKVTNINDIEFIIEHINHSKFDKKNPMEVVAKVYFDLSYIMSGFDFKRGNYELFEINSVRNNKAIHKKSKNFRTEMVLRMRNLAEEESTGSYGTGLYGAGLYGGGNLTLSGILNKSVRFRFILFDTLNGEIIIVNNCKTSDDYSKQYSEDLNVIEYVVNGDKEIQFISKVESNGYKYYELCNI